MEQKLTQFRARRQAENAMKKDQCAALQSETVMESDQTETPAPHTENIPTATDSPQSQVRPSSYLVHKVDLKVNILK